MSKRWCVMLVMLIVLAGAACAGPSTVTPEPTRVTPTPRQARPTLEPERRQVWQRPSGQDEREVKNTTSAGQGDRVWTEQYGRALLMWPDLWVRLYDDTDLHVEECEVVTDVCLAMDLGTALNGGVSRAGQRITWTTKYAEIKFTGTTIMVAYHPGSQLTIVRVFDGQVKVRNLMGLGRAEIVDAREWVLVEPNKPPQVSDQLDEMRGLAQELDLWDVFHEVELDVQRQFGPDASYVPPENVDIVFVEPGPEPTRPTPTPVPTSPTPTSVPTSPTPTVTRPTPTPEPQCEVVANALNLRPGPGTNYVPSITQLRQGTHLKPLARSPDSGWIQVQVEGTDQEGWVSAKPQYVDCGDFDPATLQPGEVPPTPTPSPTPTPPPSFETTPARDIALTAPCEPCTTLAWRAENVRAVYLDGERVNDHGSRDVCLDTSDAYDLMAGYADEIAYTYDFRVETDAGDIAHSVSVAWVYPRIHFWADANTVDPGGCTTLHWEVENAGEVYLDGEAVASYGSQEVCPTQPRTYTLRVVTACGEEEDHQPIDVSTPTPKPDLVVQIVSIDNTTIVWGEQPWTWIHYRVCNIGDAELPAGQIYLRAWTNGSPTSGYMVVEGPIRPGLCVESKFAVGHDNGWPVGDYTVQMEVDYRYLIEEANEDNNFSNSIQFTVVPPEETGGPAEDDFIGNWYNVDPDTGGTTKILIWKEESAIFVHGYGRCHPTDCDWGTVQAHLEDSALIAEYEFSFKVSRLTMTLEDDNLRVFSTNRFTDGSNRDYDSTEYFYRVILY